MTSLIQYGEDFDVIGSIIFGRLHFWRHWFNIVKILSKFGEQQLVMVNYAYGLNQSETGKYFEWIIIVIILVWFHTRCLVRVTQHAVRRSFLKEMVIAKTAKYIWTTGEINLAWLYHQCRLFWGLGKNLWVNNPAQFPTQQKF